MASQQQLKGRIRSVKSTKQITKAMQMVAASKMRRAQDATKSSSLYARTAGELLAYLQSQGVTDRHPLFVTRPIKCRLIVLIAADKGLAGAYNSNVFRTYLTLLKDDDKAGVVNHTLTIGRKASQFVARLKDTDVVGSYMDIPDFPDGREFYAMLNTALDMYEREEVDDVTVIYTEFISSISQLATRSQLLPAGLADTHNAVSTAVADATYEPSSSEVLDAVARRLVGARLFQALLDARASEHSMRMMAMKNATDNANDLVDDLTLEMNKARQASITQELAEISAGVEAMN